MLVAGFTAFDLDCDSWEPDQVEATDGSLVVVALYFVVGETVADPCGELELAGFAFAA